MDEVFFTNEIFLQGTNSGNINRAQVELFGLSWPPKKKGWKKLIINRWYPKTTIDLFLGLKKIKPKSEKHYKINLLWYDE